MGRSHILGTSLSAGLKWAVPTGSLNDIASSLELSSSREEVISSAVFSDELADPRDIAVAMFERGALADHANA